MDELKTDHGDKKIEPMEMLRHYPNDVKEVSKTSF